MEEENKEQAIEENKIIDNEGIMEDIRGKTSFKEPEKLIEERKDKFIKFIKGGQIWVIAVLIIAIILGVYIRSMPMQDHGGKPGLWDITTNTWTLGPDLDPWLFFRQAKIIIEEGALPKRDMMRNVPLGFDNSIETQLLPRMIDWTYHFINVFKDVNAEFAGVIFPVIMFGFTIIFFFLFVRELFTKKSKENIMRANIIALISTFFMIVVPAFLSRTVAGIPEKESAAFFFMFLAFYLFLKAWKSEKLKSSIILGVLAGITTALMGLVWGGVIYVFGTVSIASLIAFVLNKVNKKEVIVYGLWIFFSFSIMNMFSGRFSIIGLLSSLDTQFAFAIFSIFITHVILWNTKISKIKVLKKIKLPKNIISLILGIILLIILGSIAFGPSFIISKIMDLNRILFKPVTGRWNITVAENRQPYFTEWASNFGPFIKNIPVLFWLFFVGSVVLFKNMFNKIKEKDSWILTGLYVLFFCGLVFSRYSGSSTFTGENFISKAFYYGGVIILGGALVYYYLKYHKEGNKGFEEINYEYLFLFSLFIICLFTARSAVRLIMVLAPVAPIFAGYLIVECIFKFRKIKDETWKIIFGAFTVLILLSSGFVFWNFYNQVKGQAYSFVPSMYNQQWQKAMQWVREETPEDAVFSHWWDYGYWVQSIGNRATVLDGGNAIAYWNYLMGRLVLTGDNQNDALEFLYNHNATHLLIDSTDIGKYTAFSSIGSDENYDRYSWFGNFLLDEKQVQETKDQTIYFYSGGTALDEDLIIKENEKQVLLPGQRTGVGAIFLPIKKSGDSQQFGQPYVIMIYQNVQHKVDLRYLYINGEFLDFESGINATAYIYPIMIIEGQGVKQNPIGAAMFISPRLMRGMLSQIYLLDDPLNNFPNIKLAHTEPNLMVDSLRSQGMSLPEFVYYQGTQGPIKIWEIEYTGKEKIKQEYLDIDYSKYISWEL